MDLPRDDLTRSVPFHLERADENADGLTLEGYAAVFDSPTRIDSWEGFFDEVIARGAFAKTIKERKPVIQFDHGQHPLVGSIPLGSIDVLREDDHGLYVRARLHDNWLVQPVRDAIASGSVDGMSFRFSVVKEQVDESPDVPLRTVQEVKLYEVGPVVFPAYEATSVGVRSQVTAILADPTARAELARAIVLGTPDAEAARAGTSDEEAAPSQEPPDPGHSGLSPDERDRALALLDLEV
ncbi:MAG: HK97 family phage prohead protease [Microthrixaceae bacterium]|nr:HK97 family phage prohead protease [Microthrixaceae bacterium]